MALEGTLRDFSFADILQLISLQRKTGVLTVKDEGNVVTISFLDGCIVGSSSLSQHPEDRIGLILLKKGELTDAELDAALRKQEETLQRLGRILIDHHVVAAESVRDALQQQILQIIYRVFRWADGDYHFSQETDVDYDRDLLYPMAADSIIMEGARMTDEWPFIDQKIPDRDVVFIKVNPDRAFDVKDNEEGDFDDLSFNFVDSPDEDVAKVDTPKEETLTAVQLTVYNMVNGRESLNELILESSIVEFETCKAMADLLDKDLVRHATQEEVAKNLRSEIVIETQPAFSLGAIPWLALPFLILLGFSMTIMPFNPLNPTFSINSAIREGSLVNGAAWFWMNHLSQAAETSYFLDGVYPDNVLDLEESVSEEMPNALNILSREFRIVTRGGKMMVTASDPTGHSGTLQIISRSLAWEGGVSDTDFEGPGVRLLRD